MIRLSVFNANLITGFLEFDDVFNRRLLSWNCYFATKCDKAVIFRFEWMKKSGIAKYVIDILAVMTFATSFVFDKGLRMANNSS